MGIVLTLHKYKKKEREVCLVSIRVAVASLTHPTSLRCIKIPVYSSYNLFCPPKIIKWIAKIVVKFYFYNDKLILLIKIMIFKEDVFITVSIFLCQESRVDFSC